MNVNVIILKVMSYEKLSIYLRLVDKIVKRKAKIRIVYNGNIIIFIDWFELR